MTTQSPVYIIGNTPLAYYLAGKLSLAEENVRLIAGYENTLFSSPITIREDSLIQKNTLKIPTETIMHTPAKMVIFAIHPSNLKSFLAYFSKSKAKECPIISFCHETPSLPLADALQSPIIQAYFDGWINQSSSKALSYLGCINGITLSMNEQHPYFETVQKILSKTYIKLNFITNNEQNFWNHFLPYTTCSLFSLYHNKNTREITQNPKLRQSLITLLDELISIVPQDISIDKEQIISGIYSTPSSYTWSINKDAQKQLCGELNFILSTLQYNNYQPHLLPNTSKIIKEKLQQYFG